ncbi:MAG: hypothetical protein Q9164_007719 [Protoblastenia rupestris]
MGDSGRQRLCTQVPCQRFPRDLTLNQFPPNAISDKSIFSDSNLTTNCAWKGTSSYYNINLNGDVLKDAAWYYPAPKDAAKNIKDHVAFYKTKVQVSVED